ncbi:MAG: hypothetical protein IJS39_10320 [Synergistaceae bacterium]|nr:hypothetical protein [Synergistaceae bacterium]
MEDYKVEDGYLSPKEILDATYISSGTFEDKGISSLKGIEYLVALSGLNCSNNEIEELNLSNLQLLTALFCHKNQITELDLSNNRLLEYINCSDNNISSFSMNYCPALKSFYCNNNHITTGLDLSNRPLLETVNCGENSIPFLNITNTPLLEYVSCNSNDITELDISNHQYLENILCTDTPLRVLKADNCPRIEKIYCSDCELVSLSFKNCPALTELLCTNNYLTELDLSGSSNLKELYCSKNNIAALDLSHNPNLTSLYCYSNDLEELDLSANKELDFVMANNNRISKLNVSACTKLSRLDCEHNRLEELDVSANTSLLRLYCWDNQITQLDVSKCRSLQRLVCYRNSLTDINVSDNPALTLLNCWDNNLSAIDVSNCPELYEFYCSTNQLTELDTSANPKIYELLCGRNQLRTLDLSGNPELYRLSCYDNQLRTLNITSNDKLEILTCSNNQLIDLDLSGNPALYTLECSANYLNILDLSHNPELGRIFCNYTTIRSIDITNCPALWDIECKKGSLTMLDLSSNDAWAVMDGNSFEGLELINTSSEQYPYKTDMRPYVSENFSRVSNVRAFDRTGAEINALFSQYEGAVHFASMPVRMTYDYNTGNNTWSDEEKIMTVTVSIPTRSFIYLPKVEPVVQGRDEYVEVPDTSIQITEETVTDETGKEKTIPKAEVTVTYSLHYVSHASLYDIVNESDDASFDIVYVPYERETQDTPTIPETPDIPASPDIPANHFTGSSSGGGCNSGLGLGFLAAILTLLFMRRKRGIFLLCLLLVCSTAYAENLRTSDYTLPIQLENYSPAGTYSTNFALTPELRDTIAKIRGISSDRLHSYSEIASAGTWTVQPSDLYNLSRNGEYGGVVLPVTSGAASRDYYVIMCVFSNDVRPGEMISLQGFEVSADTMETVYSREHSYAAARWVTLDDQLNRIEYIPENRRVYLAVSFAPEYINTGILTVIRGEYITENNPLERLDDDIAKRIAEDLGISPDKLQYVSRAYLGDPREPTQAMKDYVKSSDMEIILNMPTVSIDEGYEGMYFSYELPDDIWEQVKGKSLSEYPIFALNDSDLSGAGRVKSSSIFWGVINLFELNGGKMDSLGVKEFLIAGLLQAGKPFSLYLAKLIIMLLLGGCSSGINPSIVPVIILGLIVIKFPRKH